MTLDVDHSVDCGVCDEVTPSILVLPARTTFTRSSPEAMAARAIRALHWLEGETCDGRE